MATTFMGKGVFPDDHANALGALGFMRHDYANFGFDRADVIVCVGYDLQEYAPEQINPDARKKIIHIHRYPAEVDAHYHVAVGIEGNIPQSLDALANALKKSSGPAAASAKIRALLRNEIDRGANDDSFPVKPQRFVADIRGAMGRSDIVLVDTGAVKMWMAQAVPDLRRQYVSDFERACDDGLCAARCDRNQARVPGAQGTRGDGGWELPYEFARAGNRRAREDPVRCAGVGGQRLRAYQVEDGPRAWARLQLRLHEPRLCRIRQQSGREGIPVSAAAELLPTLSRALADDSVSLVVCPVDYSENLALTKMLGEITDPF